MTAELFGGGGGQLIMMFHNVWVGCATVSDRKSVSWRLGGEGMYVCIWKTKHVYFYGRPFSFY